MDWGTTREIIDTVSKDVISDAEIKNCDIQLEKQRIQFYLSSTEAASQVIEAMNGKVIKDRKITASYDKQAIQK